MKHDIGPRYYNITLNIRKRVSQSLSHIVANQQVVQVEQ